MSVFAFKAVRAVSNDAQAAAAACSAAVGFAGFAGGGGGAIAPTRATQRSDPPFAKNPRAEIARSRLPALISPNDWVNWAKFVTSRHSPTGATVNAVPSGFSGIVGLSDIPRNAVMLVLTPEIAGGVSTVSM